MKMLLVMRHAKSSWNDSSLSDHDRPLNKRGKHDAPQMGQLLSDENLRPDLILSSTANRARSTATLVANACRYRKAVEINPELYPTSVPAAVRVIKDLQHDYRNVLLIGHNPGMEYLVSTLTGTDVVFSTAAIAQISLEIDAWEDLQADSKGVLVNMWKPKELFY